MLTRRTALASGALAALATPLPALAGRLPPRKLPHHGSGGNGRFVGQPALCCLTGCVNWGCA